MKRRPYNHERYFFEDLSHIKPCNLKSEETSLEDACAFCRCVMRYFSRCENITPNQTQLKQVLISLGACEYDKAAKKFIELKDDSVYKLIDLTNNIQFPLQAFTQIFNQKPIMFKYVFKSIVYWSEKWLEAQQLIQTSSNNTIKDL